MSVDSTKGITVLDRKATIAIGNQLKEGAGYRYLFSEQSRLVDSLLKQIKLQKEKSEIYETETIPSLKELTKETKNENSFLKEKIVLIDESYKGKIKSLKGNFWKGLGIGSGLTLIAFLLTSF